MAKWVDRTYIDIPKDRDVLVFLKEPWSRLRLVKWFEPWGVWLNTCDPTPDLPSDERYGIGSELPVKWLSELENP